MKMPSTRIQHLISRLSQILFSYYPIGSVVDYAQIFSNWTAENLTQAEPPSNPLDKKFNPGYLNLWTTIDTLDSLDIVSCQCPFYATVRWVHALFVVVGKLYGCYCYSLPCFKSLYCSYFQVREFLIPEASEMLFPYYTATNTSATSLWIEKVKCLTKIPPNIPKYLVNETGSQAVRAGGVRYRHWQDHTTISSG